MVILIPIIIIIIIIASYMVMILVVVRDVCKRMCVVRLDLERPRDANELLFWPNNMNAHH